MRVLDISLVSRVWLMLKGWKTLKILRPKRTKTIIFNPKGEWVSSRWVIQWSGRRSLSGFFFKAGFCYFGKEVRHPRKPFTGLLPDKSVSQTGPKWFLMATNMGTKVICFACEWVMVFCNNLLFLVFFAWIPPSLWASSDLSLGSTIVNLKVWFLSSIR